MLKEANAYVLLFFGLLEFTHSFEIGALYRYNYATTVLLNEVGLSHAKSSHRAVGYRITADVLVTPLWQSDSDPREKLLKLEIEKRQLYVPSKDSFKPHSSSFTSVTSSPIYLLWNNGDIAKVFVKNGDDSNIEKGIAGILQLKTEDSEILQTDISGECKIEYKANGETVQKRKLSCKHPLRAQHYMHPNKVQVPSTVILSEANYELLNEKFIVKNAIGREHISIDSGLWDKAAIRVHSKYELTLQSQEQTASKLKGQNVEEVIKQLSADTGTDLVADTIIAIPQKTPCRENCKSLPILVKEFKPNLKNGQLSTFKSAHTFVKLLQKFRSATKEELLKVMKNSKNKNILPQIMDLLASAQTPAAWEAALEYIDFTTGNIDIAERFFLGTSMSLHPTDGLISRLLKLTDKKIKDEKLKTSLIMTLGAVTKTYCKLDSSKSSSLVVSEVADYLVNSLNSCRISSCKLLYLRGLKNAAIPSTLPTLLKYIMQGKPYALVALSAMKNIGPQHFTDAVIAALKQIYYETVQKQDSTTRIVAAELLISSHHNSEIIPDLIHSLAKEESTEISTYLISKIFELSEKDEQYRSVINNILKKQKIANYHTLSQNGNSAVFTKPLLVGTGVNITYGMEMEMISGGLFKQSAFTVNVLKEKDLLPLLSIGLFAEGLCSIAGEESCSSEPEEETTAGMELKVLGVGIRPYTFFRGTGELMSHVWAGTGSDPISALQANLLLVDHRQIVVLQNGFVVDLKIQGALSLDLSASIDISIWNRNSHSIVKNSGALALEGRVDVSSSFAESWIAFSLGGESYIDFITDFDFYNSPYKTCLQMSQPDLTIMYNVNKTQAIPESQHKIQISSKRKYFIPGKSYSFHHKNVDACSVLLSQ